MGRRSPGASCCAFPGTCAQPFGPARQGTAIALRATMTRRSAKPSRFAERRHAGAVLPRVGLFEEPGALELVSQLALEWCTKHLKAAC